MQREKERSQLPKGTPYVPYAPALTAVLGTSADLFSVRPLEMMRKATDELTLALHWYVLYTMVHSAAMREAGAVRTAVTFPIRRPIQIVDGRTVKAKAPREKKIKNLGSAADLYKDMWDYHHDQNDGNTHDFRLLIHHIKRVKMRPLYYEACAAEIYSDIIRLCTNVAYHRNYVVPTDSLDSSSLSFAEINSRANDMIVHNFFEYLKKLLKYILYDKQNEGRAKSATDGMSRHVRVACAEALHAARVHFLGVQHISTVYSRLFDPTPGPGDVVTITLADTLEYLKGRVSSQNPDASLHATAFTLLALWTRFSTRATWDTVAADDEVDYEDPVDDFEMVARRTQSRADLKGLGQVKIFRSRMPGERYEKKFVCQDDHFGIDPCSITNLDLLNRVVDVAGLALRRILIHVIDMALTSTSWDDFAAVVIQQLFELKEGKVSFLVPDEQLGIRFFREIFKADDVATDGDEEVVVVTLFDDFCELNELDKSPGSLKTFARFSPHFGDPRFLGQFFKIVLDKMSEQGLAREAQTFLDIIGRASHQKYLVSDIHLSRKQLKMNVSEVVVFVTALCDLSGAELGDLGDALQELTDVVVPWYCRWRGRQDYIMQEGTEKLPERASRTLDGLLAAMKRSGSDSLPPLPDKADDNSMSAMESVLKPAMAICWESHVRAEGRAAQIAAKLASARTAAPSLSERDAASSGDDDGEDALEDDEFFVQQMLALRQ